jgi:adenylate cyclase, class 2
MGLEIEAKFWAPDLEAFRARLLSAGAQIVVPRLLEHNERFDTPDGRLRQSGEVLRLRRDQRQTLTYKRALASPETRSETELEVDDLEQARALLLGLGYVPIFVYEKYREVMKLEDARVMLDELPFGTFVEIEGPSLESIGRVAARLGLDWTQRVARSYLSIFEALRQRLSHAAPNATFADLQPTPHVTLHDLGLPSPTAKDSSK